MASVYCITPEYVLNQTADWLVWAYKNAVDMEMQKFKILFSMLTGQDLTAETKEANELELKKIGIGGR